MRQEARTDTLFVFVAPSAVVFSRPAWLWLLHDAEGWEISFVRFLDDVVGLINVVVLALAAASFANEM